jgi:predicted regulator of Ras-like GTPase activity (Roadblock/LC7/MglB family)
MEEIFKRIKNVDGVISTAIVNKEGLVIFEGSDENGMNQQYLGELGALMTGAECVGKLFKTNIEERCINTPQGELRILSRGEYVILILCNNGTNIDEIKHCLSNLKTATTSLTVT